MNKDQAKLKRRQIKRVAKKVRGELARDNVKKDQGSLEKPFGVIPETFGDTKEAVKENLDTLQVKLSETKAAAEQR